MTRPSLATFISPALSASTAAFCLSGLFLAPQTAQAQSSPNLSAPPLYGTVNLRSGFTPDPYGVDVYAGGSTDASFMNLGSGCVGFIAPEQPDVRVNYQSGSFPLSFNVMSGVDTTLLINGPDGRWYCNDDTNGFNPQVGFSSPLSGQYDIWIGTFSSGPAQPAVLQVTELGGSSPPPISNYLNIGGDPLYGTVNLRSGFVPDPYSLNVYAGGPLDASTAQNVGSGCFGYVTPGQPDVRVNYQAGGFPLTFNVTSGVDTTILINGPDGRWYCNDDANGFNPQVRFSSPQSGQYDIWVGTFGNMSPQSATLQMTEF